MICCTGKWEKNVGAFVVINMNENTMVCEENFLLPPPPVEIVEVMIKRWPSRMVQFRILNTKSKQ
jgi:hypothetical protein